MSDTKTRPTPLLWRIAGIGSALVAMVAVVFFVGQILRNGGDVPEHPEPTVADTSGDPIAAEAGMFRLEPGDLAVEPSVEVDRPAHARTLAMYRRLRAYPGAPPRVPHGLTEEEFRLATCNNCHQRGGWVARFGTYAPATPHPEYGACLQCHAARDALVGIPADGPPGGDSCGQCHVSPEAPAPTFAAEDWRTTRWPQTNQRAMPESPHWIPHDLHMRTNCVACHAGPGAEEEIRTDHADRSACRQCHVPATSPAPEPFPPDGPASGDEAGGPR